MRRRNKSRYPRTLGMQLLACILIVLFIIVIKKMDHAIVNRASDAVEEVFGRDYSYSQVLDGLRSGVDLAASVPVRIGETLAWDDQDFNFVPPVDTVATLSNGMEDPGLSMIDKESQIHAIGGGAVVKIGENDKYHRYMKISHGDRAYSIYGGLDEIYVDPLDKVRRGQLIASVKPVDGATFLFELWIDGKLVDPADYIEF